jgi:tetratricopeptide (TPR) repeat protein
MDRRHLLLGLALVVLVSGLQLRDSLDGLRQYRDNQPREVLEQAATLRAELPVNPEGALLARKPHLAHYAGLRPAAYPQVISDWDSFWQFAFERGARWIAVGPREKAVPGETRVLEHLDEAAAVQRRLEAAGTTLYELAPAPRWQDWARMPRREEFLEEARTAVDVGDSLAAVAPYFDAGLILVAIGDWAGAEPDLDSSLALREQFPDALETADADYLRLTLALCRLELGRHAEGLAILKAEGGNLPAEFTESLEADRWFVTGRLWAGVGEASRARFHLQRSLAMYEAAGRAEAARATRHYLESLDERKATRSD